MPFVRKAQLGDLGQLAEFDEWRQATKEAVRAGECFVAGHDTDVLAYAIFNRRFFGRPFVATVFVHPEHRRSGLGSALMSHIESLTDHKQLWTSTNIENLAMQGTLCKLGFRLSGVVDNLAELPELVYFKPLSKGPHR